MVMMVMVMNDGQSHRRCHPPGQAKAQVSKEAKEAARQLGEEVPVLLRVPDYPKRQNLRNSKPHNAQHRRHLGSVQGGKGRPDEPAQLPILQRSNLAVSPSIVRSRVHGCLGYSLAFGCLGGPGL